MPKAARGRITVNTLSCLFLSLNGSEGFSYPCHALLCQCCHYGEMENVGVKEGGGRSGALPTLCRLFTAMALRNKVEALWMFGGRLSSLAGNHTGTTWVYSEYHSHNTIQHMVHNRSRVSSTDHRGLTWRAPFMEYSVYMWACILHCTVETAGMWGFNLLVFSYNFTTQTHLLLSSSLSSYCG